MLTSSKARYRPLVDHVAHRADLVVERAPALRPDRLGDGDLHALHAIAVPQRFEDRVGEAEREEVLDRVLPEVVIDAACLRLVEVLVNQLVELPRGPEIAAEWLLDNDARPGCG